MDKVPELCRSRRPNLVRFMKTETETMTDTSPPKPLKTMVAVGSVSSSSARLWARLAKDARLVLELRSATDVRRVGPWLPAPGDGGTMAFTYPDDFPGEAPLLPTTVYEFRLLTEANALVGEGRFRTAPQSPAQAPTKWTLAFLSCHQPFDDDGHVSQSALDMLAAAEKTLRAKDVDLVLFLGDQAYADAPKCLSLFRKAKDEEPLLHLSPAEIKTRYHDLYRRSWSLAAWQRLHAYSSTACLPDDHEVVDNWGSGIEHNGAQWQKLGQTALDVAFSWQGLRCFAGPSRDGTSFQQSFRWGNAGVFMLDVRSHRREAETASDSQIVGAQQLEALETFLNRSGDLSVLFFGVPVPMVHLPDWATSVGHKLSFRANDVEDRWSNPCWAATRDQLLRRLDEHRRAHPKQRLVILSGDIHAGWGVQLLDDKAVKGESDPASGRPIIQLVSSAITNGDSLIVGALSEAALYTSKLLTSDVIGLRVEHLKGVQDRNRNPYGGLNIGFVDVERSSEGEVGLRFTLVGHGKGDASAEPRVVFESELI